MTSSGRQLVFRVLILFCALSVSACGYQRPALTDEMRERVEVLEVYLEPSPKEIGIYYPTRSIGMMTGTFGGLFTMWAGAAVDLMMNSVVEDAATEVAAPFRAMLNDYDFDSVLNAAMEDVIASTDTIQLVGPFQIKDGERSRNVLRNSGYDAAIRVDPKYSLSRYAKIIEVVLIYAVLMGPEISGQGREVTKRTRFAAYQSPERDWNRTTLKEELNRGAREVALLMVMDLADSRTGKHLRGMKEKIPVQTEDHKIKDRSVYRIGASGDGGIAYYRLKSGKLIAAAQGQALRSQARPD